MTTKPANLVRGFKAKHDEAVEVEWTAADGVTLKTVRYESPWRKIDPKQIDDFLKNVKTRKATTNG